MERQALVNIGHLKTQWSEMRVKTMISAFTDDLALCPCIKLETGLL
jgi:hypothetical protein